MTPKHLTTRDGLIILALFVGGVLLRLPFRSELAYHWDDAQFALAIGEYNVALSQPHAPGYFLYVMLGRLANEAVGDPYASLVWLNLIFSSVLPALLYWLGSSMFDRRTGLAAGLFALTSPLIWFHGCVGLNYVADAFVACLIVWRCWRAMQRGGTASDAFGLGALIGLAGGIRPQTAITLFPLLLFTHFQFDRCRFVKFALMILTATVVTLAWFLPMVRLSGGLDVYLDIIQRYSQNNSSMTFSGGGFQAVIDNIYWLGIFCLNGLMLGAVALAAAVLYRFVQRDRARWQAWRNQHGLAMAVSAWWILPAIIFGTILQFTLQPGHVLVYLPALFLMTGVVVSRLRKLGVYIGLVVLISLANAFAFLLWPAKWDGWFNDQARTARELQLHERTLRQALSAVRSQYKPGQALVVHPVAAHFLFGFRHFQLHLPEFDQYQLMVDPTIPAPSGRTLWYAHGGRLGFRERIEIDNKRVLVAVPPGLTWDALASLIDIGRASELAGSGKLIYEVESIDFVDQQDRESVQKLNSPR